MGNSQCNSIICQKNTSAQEDNHPFEAKDLKNNKNSIINTVRPDSQIFYTYHKHINECNKVKQSDIINNSHGNRVLMYIKELPIKAYQDNVIFQDNLIKFSKKINKDYKDDFNNSFSIRAHDDLDIDNENKKKLMSKSLGNKIIRNNKNITLKKKDNILKIKKHSNFQSENLFEYHNFKNDTINSYLLSISDRHKSNLFKESKNNIEQKINSESKCRNNLKREKYIKNILSNNISPFLKIEKPDFDSKSLNWLNEKDLNDNSRYKNLKFENKSYRIVNGQTTPKTEYLNVEKEKANFIPLCEKVKSHENSKVSFGKFFEHKIDKNSTSTLIPKTQKETENFSNITKKTNAQQIDINKIENKSFNPEIFKEILKNGTKDPIKIEKSIDDKLDLMNDNENSFIKLNNLNINKSDDILVNSFLIFLYF